MLTHWQWRRPGFCLLKTKDGFFLNFLSQVDYNWTWLEGRIMQEWSTVCLQSQPRQPMTWLAEHALLTGTILSVLYLCHSAAKPQPSQPNSSSPDLTNLLSYMTFQDPPITNISHLIHPSYVNMVTDHLCPSDMVLTQLKRNWPSSSHGVLGKFLLPPGALCSEVDLVGTNVGTFNSQQYRPDPCEKVRFRGTPNAHR